MGEEGKGGSGDALDLEERIISLCQANPAGVTDKLLLAAIPGTDISHQVTALNRLLSQGRLEIFKQGKTLLYRLKDPEAAAKVKGADTEEKLIYQIIEEAGNKGIWSRDIRYKSNLLLTQVNKVLRNLESRRLIKAVKSVSASKKKVYMLSHLDPDISVTGGAWYSDQDFESEFVEVLNQQTYRFLMERLGVARVNNSDPIACKNASFASSQDIWKFISELKISKVQLSVNDIEMILNTLIYDGKVEKTVTGSSASSSSDKGGLTNMYRAVEPLIESTGLMRMPCGVCPVFADCHDGGVISPSTCKYMKDWLDIETSDML